MNAVNRPRPIRRGDDRQSVMKDTGIGDAMGAETRGDWQPHCLTFSRSEVNRAP